VVKREASETAGASTVLLEVSDGVATITMNRPDALNALTIPMKRELLSAFRSLERDRAVRAVLLTGAGRAFCAGQASPGAVGTGCSPARDRDP